MKGLFFLAFLFLPYLPSVEIAKFRRVFFLIELEGSDELLIKATKLCCRLNTKALSDLYKPVFESQNLCLSAFEDQEWLKYLLH